MFQMYEKQRPKQCRNLRLIKISARGRCTCCSPPRDKYTAGWDLTQRLFVMWQHGGSESISISSFSFCLFIVHFLVNYRRMLAGTVQTTAEPTLVLDKVVT